MATLNAEHINPFLMAAKKVLQDMCFVDVAIQKPILKEAKFDHDYWVIIIGVTGEMRQSYSHQTVLELILHRRHYLTVK